jgi:hypothetical protein
LAAQAPIYTLLDTEKAELDLAYVVVADEPRKPY